MIISKLQEILFILTDSTVWYLPVYCSSVCIVCIVAKRYVLPKTINTVALTATIVATISTSYDTHFPQNGVLVRCTI